MSKKLIKNIGVLATPTGSYAKSGSAQGEISIYKDAAIVCENGEILGIYEGDTIPNGQFDEIIDAKGGYVAPGLIDLHIHGYLGKDVCDGEPESIRTIAEGIVANGVTGFLPTTMTVDMKVIRKALECLRSLKEESKTWNGTAILGCHAEGPFINAKKKGAQDERFILKPDADFVKANEDIIKIIDMKMINLKNKY